MIENQSLPKTKRKNSIREYLATLGQSPKNGSKWLIEDHKRLLDILDRSQALYSIVNEKCTDFIERDSKAFRRLNLLPNRLRNWLMGY